MDHRRCAVANAVASVRLEGLEPGTETIDVLNRWGSGDLSTAELGEFAARVARGESTHVPLSPRAS